MKQSEQSHLESLLLSKACQACIQGSGLSKSSSKRAGVVAGQSPESQGTSETRPRQSMCRYLKAGVPTGAVVMTRVNLYSALKLLKFYDGANGRSRLPARQEMVSGFECNIGSERKIYRDVAFPNCDRIESITFLVFGVVASGATN